MVLEFGFSIEISMRLEGFMNSFMEVPGYERKIKRSLDFHLRIPVKEQPKEIMRPSNSTNRDRNDRNFSMIHYG